MYFRISQKQSFKTGLITNRFSGMFLVKKEHKQSLKMGLIASPPKADKFSSRMFMLFNI
ncbi:MAG: hypothetical protein WC435_00130 [Candidatus Paceibacterota bacterium]